FRLTRHAFLSSSSARPVLSPQASRLLPLRVACCQVPVAYSIILTECFMQKHIAYWLIPLLLWSHHQSVNAQTAYEPPSSSTGGFPFSYIILIAIAGIVGFVVYKFYSTRNSQPPHYLENQPKIEPVQGPTSVPRPAPATGSIFISYRRDDSADITGRIYDRLV